MFGREGSVWERGKCLGGRKVCWEGGKCVVREGSVLEGGKCLGGE